jgi:hypothetical protein
VKGGQIGGDGGCCWEGFFFKGELVGKEGESCSEVGRH